MKKLLLFLLTSLLLSSTADAQLSLTAYRDVVLSSTGTPITTAAITVFLPNTTTKPPGGIFSTAVGGSLSNPFAVDSLGNYTFYAIPGVYDILISIPGLADTTIEDVHLASSSSYLFTGSSAAPSGCMVGEFYYDTTTGRITFCGAAGISVPGSSILDTATVGVLNNTRVVDDNKFACTSVGVQAAIDALPNTGGHVDASGCEGAQTFATSISLGSATKPVRLSLGAATWTLTSPAQIILFADSVLEGLGHGTLIQGNHTIALVVIGAAGVRANNAVVRDLAIDNTTSGNASSIGIDIVDTLEALIDNVRITNVETGINLRHTGGFSTLYTTIRHTRIRLVVNGIDFATTSTNANNVIGGKISNIANDGIIIRGSSNNIFGVAIEGFESTGANGVHIISGNGNSVIGCHFENINSGMADSGVRIDSGVLRTSVAFNMFLVITTHITNSADVDELIHLGIQNGFGTVRSRRFRVNLSTGAQSAFFDSASLGTVRLRDATDSAAADLVLGEAEIDGDLNHDGSNAGFFGVTPVARPGGTDEIKAALALLGLLTDGSATPLDLDGGTLTVTTVSPLEGTLTNFPRWILKVVDHTDMVAAATAATFTLWTLPASTVIHDVMATVDVAWAGTGPVSAAVCSVGTAGGSANDLTLDDNFFATGVRYELHDASANGGKGTLLFDTTDKFAPRIRPASGDIEIQCDLTGGNHSTTSAGQASIRILVSQPFGNATIEAN